MSFSEIRAFLIAYDVADPKRLTKVHRFLAGEALAVQYSVFVTMASERQIDRIRAGIEQRIDWRQDDVRIYPLPARCQAHLIGRQILPPGIVLADHQLVRLLREEGLAGAVQSPSVFP